MQPKLNRLLRALAREGLDVTYDGRVYTVRLQGDANTPPAEVLLPPELPVEGKAFQQLAALAALKHPHGGQVKRVRATGVGSRSQDPGLPPSTPLMAPRTPGTRPAPGDEARFSGFLTVTARPGP